MRHIGLLLIILLICTNISFAQQKNTLQRLQPNKKRHRLGISLIWEKAFIDTEPKKTKDGIPVGKLGG